MKDAAALLIERLAAQVQELQGYAEVTELKRANHSDSVHDGSRAAKIAKVALAIRSSANVLLRLAELSEDAMEAIGHKTDYHNAGLPKSHSHHRDEE